ncbi:hypothetical protein JOE57_000563 [Microlunatus panaciterrae]|uniref:Uncharacterized protein n=1 Tax=Microlunatus panaciterrae TaxID=400768 RepID=A0ABS2RF99_9ACTN|nr:hypothetical protein [Microlunatus panaciterrae]MBM7797642.1 hypothetical protein [Microlunatus panaciterrae]
MTEQQHPNEPQVEDEPRGQTRSGPRHEAAQESLHEAQQSEPQAPDTEQEKGDGVEAARRKTDPADGPA